MKLPEIWDLFEHIAMYYPGFNADDAKATAWHRLLSDVPLEVAISNLERHARTERFAPTVADIRGGVQDPESSTIPGVDETREWLAEMDKLRERAVPMPDYVREELRRIVQRD